MAQPLQLLFIGENGADAVVAELQRGNYAPNVQRVTNLAELEAAVSPLSKSAHPDVAISDFAVGAGFGALEALRLIQEKGVDLPLIVVSGKVRDAEVLAVLKAGAADHLTRSNLMRLNAAVERELRSARMRSERVRLENSSVRPRRWKRSMPRRRRGSRFQQSLTVITGYSDLLLGGRDLKGNATHRVGGDSALRRARRAATHQLLAFSRRQPDAGASAEDRRLGGAHGTDAHRLIGETSVVTIAASSESVFADPGRLEQVIMNLVVNAAMPCRAAAQAHHRNRGLRLVDGLAARQWAYRPEITSPSSSAIPALGWTGDAEPPLRAVFTTKNPGRGTGLGPATVYGIVRQSGGAIGISSEPGKGTIARIYLPRAKEKAEAPGPERPPAMMPLTGGETILLVEDEARVRKLIVDVLSGRGYRVLEATRGEEALRICRSRGAEIDLAVVDVVMPEMNGPELMRQIQPVCPNVRVLYISGYTDEAMVHHGISESGAAFLQKPFVPDQLARKVREVLDSRANGATEGG